MRRTLAQPNGNVAVTHAPARPFSPPWIQWLNALHFFVQRSDDRMSDLPIFANNAAALVGGLVAGDFYRTGADPDVVCVVH